MVTYTGPVHVDVRRGVDRSRQQRESRAFDDRRRRDDARKGDVAMVIP